jgi:hypothetical protein
MSEPEDHFVSGDIDDGKDEIRSDEEAVIRKCVNRRVADFSVNWPRNGRNDRGSGRPR